MLCLKELKEKWLIEDGISTPLTNNNDFTLFYKDNNVVLPIDLIEYFTLLNGTDGNCTYELYEFYSISRIKKVKQEFEDWRGVPNYQDLITNSEVSDLYVLANYHFNLFAYAIKLSPEASVENYVYVLCGVEYKKIASSFSEFVNLYLKDSVELQLG